MSQNASSRSSRDSGIALSSISVSGLVAFWAAAAVVVARVATLDAVGAVDAGFDEAVAGLLLLLLLPLPNATLPLAAGASKDDCAR